MAFRAERGPRALVRNVPAPPSRRHPRGRLRPRFWGAGPTFALVILQAAVFAVSGCLLAPFDVSHPNDPGTAWALALPASPALPLADLALPDRPSRGEQVRARVVVPVSTATRSSDARTAPAVTFGSAAPGHTDVIEPVSYVILPAALPAAVSPRRPTPVAGSPAPPVAPTTRKARVRPPHPHHAVPRARTRRHRAALPARTPIARPGHTPRHTPGDVPA